MPSAQPGSPRRIEPGEHDRSTFFTARCRHGGMHVDPRPAFLGPDSSRLHNSDSATLRDTSGMNSPEERLRTLDRLIRCHRDRSPRQCTTADRWGCEPNCHALLRGSAAGSLCGRTSPRHPFASRDRRVVGLPRSSGGKPVPVGAREVVAAACTTFDAGDHGRPDAETLGDSGQGDVLGLACWREVGDLRDADRWGEPPKGGHPQGRPRSGGATAPPTRSQVTRTPERHAV